MSGWGEGIAGILFLCVLLWLIWRYDRRTDNVEEACILSVRERYSGGLFGQYYTEVTFMVYYKNGRHRKISVSRNDPDFEELMKYVR